MNYILVWDGYWYIPPHLHTPFLTLKSMGARILESFWEGVSYQFVSEFDTFRHKFHCHKRFNLLYLFKYSIYLIFRNFRAGVGRGIYSRKVKLSQIFIQNLIEVLRYLMSPMRNRVTSLLAYLMKTCHFLPKDGKLFFIKVNLAVRISSSCFCYHYFIVLFSINN